MVYLTCGVPIALTQIAKVLGYRTTVIDPRGAFGTDARFPHEQCRQRMLAAGISESDLAKLPSPTGIDLSGWNRPRRCGTDCCCAQRAQV